MSAVEMTAATFAPARDRATPALRVGDVLGQARRIFAPRWATYSALVGVAYVPLLADATLTVHSGPYVSFDFDGSLITLGAYIWLTLANGAIYIAVAQDFAGRRPTIVRLVSDALPHLPALLKLLLLLLICLIFATLLLVVPALVVLCVCAVASPACAIEGLGPLKSMSRSAFLTKGDRWRIFGLLIELYFGLWVVSETVVSLARHFGGPIAGVMVGAPVKGVVGGFSAVAIGVLYAQLRAAREGVATERVAGVFD
jgi:hypothetical protein